MAALSTVPQCPPGPLRLLSFPASSGHHPHFVQPAVVPLDEVVDGHEVLVGAVTEPEGIQLLAELGDLLLETARLQHEPAHRLDVHVQIVDVRQTGRRLPEGDTGLGVGQEREISTTAECSDSRSRISSKT